VAGYERFERSNPSSDERIELEQVDALARQLLRHMDSAVELIAALHVYGAQSSAIQDSVAELLCGQLQFRSEVAFLVVPEELKNAAGLVRERPFPKVVRRVGAFFGDPRREVDVLSAHVFGY
jgi:hypothetical protein